MGKETGGVEEKRRKLVDTDNSVVIVVGKGKREVEDSEGEIDCDGRRGDLGR